MRLAAHPHHHIHMDQFRRRRTTHAWLRSTISAALPYLIASVFLFAYHEQWFK